MKYLLGLLFSLLVVASLAKADIIPVSGTKISAPLHMICANVGMLDGLFPALRQA